MQTFVSLLSTTRDNNPRDRSPFSCMFFVNETNEEKGWESIENLVRDIWIRRIDEISELRGTGTPS